VSRKNELMRGQISGDYNSRLLVPLS
jgi:hypothetical protein